MILEDFLIMINVINKQIQRLNPMSQTAFDVIPFFCRHNAGNDVEWKYPLRSGGIAINGKGNAHSEERLLRRLLIAPQFTIGKSGNALEQPPGRGPWRAFSRKHFVEKTARIVAVKKH